jgi:hypothetical protein
MIGVDTSPVAAQATTMASDRKKGSQLGIRMTDDERADLDWVAGMLGLEASGLVRMILRENLAPYRERAKRIQADGGGDAPPDSKRRAK